MNLPKTNLNEQTKDIPSNNLVSIEHDILRSKVIDHIKSDLKSIADYDGCGYTEALGSLIAIAVDVYRNKL